MTRFIDRLSRFFNAETRSQTARTSDPFVAEWFGLNGFTGAIQPRNALTNLAVAVRCVSLRSTSLASVPLHLFRRTDAGARSRADDVPLYDVVHGTANPNMSAYEAREFLVRSVDLYGNGYARIERNARGQVTALYPLPPPSVVVEKLASGRLRYRFSDARGAIEVLLPEDVLHIRGPSNDGMIGMSPLQIAANAIGIAVSHRETQAAFLNNSLKPSGLISFAEKLGDERMKQTRANLAANHAGSLNAGKLLMMDGGAKFEPMSFSMADQQFLEQARLSNEDVARVFDCPPTAVGITDRATYSNSEHEGKALVSMCLGPLAARVEAAMMRCLLTREARRTYYIEHDLSGLLRGDVESRFKAYRLGREIGALSANDVRRRENEPAIDGGDGYHQPANWVSLGSLPQPGAAQPSPTVSTEA